MGLDINKVLRFIFPELQIIRLINEHGFIAKKKSNSQVGYTASGSVQQPIVSGNTAMLSSAQTQPVASQPMQSVSDKKVQFAPKQKTTPKLTDVQLDAKITTMRREVLATVIGQEEAVDKLIIAIKRPFVTGFGIHTPKNTFFIIGSTSTGRHTLLKSVVQAARHENLLNHAQISQINLALYPTTAERPLFLSDLYKALHESSDLVLFENFEYAHSDVLSIISSLVTTGIYQFGERYIFQNGQLAQATGTLSQSSISEVSANGKYFAFITNSSESKLDNSFGSKFMNRVDDIVYLTPYSQDSIIDVAVKIFAELNKKTESNLSLHLSVSDSFFQHCLSMYKKAEGFKSLQNYLLNSIYRGLSEFKLHNFNIGEASLYLDFDEEKGVLLTYAKDDIESTVLFESFMPKLSTGNIDEIKAELEGIIGLDKVKDFVMDLENNLKVQQMRAEAGQKVSTLSNHMVFTGNPGTGKTTIARIVAKYLKAIGLLSTGQLREVSRPDLVGQYVGQTAKQTNEVIQSALGGVLFIDEAYGLCRDQHDTFGREAVDALVKAVEDYRDELVVIMAGYSDEMQEFMKNNPGLKSRFPHVIDFEDYSSDEMVSIAKLVAKSKGYAIADDCTEGLERLFDRSQIKGRNDGGNGRLARNVVESAILNQSRRITQNAEQIAKDDMSILVAEDFDFEHFEDFDLEKRLATIIGLDGVKGFIRTQHSMLVAEERRRAAGVTVNTTQSLNMVFTGNPGTGKTTVARVAASMFKDMGMLKKGHLVEVDRRSLVAEFVGQTAKKTEEVFRDALGGVLFIDEAYSLYEGGGGGFGKEAIDTLVKLIEDYRGEIIVILAGYKKEMADFMGANSGLESRFPLVIDFPDYNADELYAIAERFIDIKGFALADGAASVLKDQIAAEHRTSTAASGNGRMVRNLIEKIMRNQSARIASAENISSKEEFTQIMPIDVMLVSPDTAQKGFDLEETFAKVIGLTEIKDYIRSLEARLRIQNERKKLGLPVDSTQSMHMILKGNPGTGKTMIARTVADVMHNLGIISTNKLIETDRAGLVAGFVGQTAIKTTEKATEALDGVLFIDEAYALAGGGANDFGREAIDTLVKFMDDNRDRLVVMLAGYSDNMEEFLQMNPGLKSRFPNVMDFPDYSADELMLIAEELYTAKGYNLTVSARTRLSDILQEAAGQEAFGNGRYVRNVFERSVNNQAFRLRLSTDLSREELTTITDEDIVAV